MSQNTQIVDQLRRYRQQLAGIEAYWRAWHRIETWTATVQPFLRRHFPDDFADFSNWAVRPEWLQLERPVGSGPEYHHRIHEIEQRELAENNTRTQAVKARLLAFLDTLIQEERRRQTPTPQVAVAPPESVDGLPFRPFKWFKAEMCGIEEYHTKLQLAALESGAEEELLSQSGGRREASSPCSPRTSGRSSARPSTPSVGPTRYPAAGRPGPTSSSRPASPSESRRTAPSSSNSVGTSSCSPTWAASITSASTTGTNRGICCGAN